MVFPIGLAVQEALTDRATVGSRWDGSKRIRGHRTTTDGLLPTPVAGMRRVVHRMISGAAARTDVGLKRKRE